MKNIIESKVLFLILCIFLSQATYNLMMMEASAQREEITYGDNCYDYLLYKTDVELGEMFGEKFTPPYTPCKIIEIKFLIRQDPAPFRAHVFDSNRIDIFEKDVRPPVSFREMQFLIIDISKDNIFVSGDFYIAIEYTSKMKPVMAYDIDDSHNQAYSISNGNWIKLTEIEVAGVEASQCKSRGYPPKIQPLPEPYTTYTTVPEGDFMIRAVVEPAEDSDNDGLYDFEENEIGTDPLLSDTDKDGFTDGEEVKTYQTDPLQADIVEEEIVSKTEEQTPPQNMNKTEEVKIIAPASQPSLIQLPIDLTIMSAVIMVCVTAIVMAVLVLRGRKHTR